GHPRRAFRRDARREDAAGRDRLSADEQERSPTMTVSEEPKNLPAFPSEPVPPEPVPSEPVPSEPVPARPRRITAKAESLCDQHDVRAEELRYNAARVLERPVRGVRGGVVSLAQASAIGDE